MIRTCGRCGHADHDVRSTIANREREARQDGREFIKPAFAVENRCRDKDACAARVARTEGTR